MLNNHNYLHVKIRKLLKYLEYLTDMKVITDLDQDFEDVRLVGKLSYITLDFKHNTCFAMSHKITRQEMEIIEEIMISLDWLEVGRRYQARHN